MANHLQPYGGHLNLGACNTPTYCGTCTRPLPPTNICMFCDVPAALAPMSAQPELCYAAAVPPAYANLHLDVSFDGTARVEQVILRAQPNDHTFNLTTDVLPFGWTFDAVNGVLYYPQGYQPKGAFAVWTAPNGMDACGAYVWTATEVCLRIESGNCGEMASLKATAQAQYFCFSAKYLTTITQALADLRAAFGQGVQLSKDGGLTENSLFQLAANSQPAAFAGSANVAAGTWALGRCDAAGFSLTAAQICTGLNNITPVAVPPAVANVVVTTANGCATVPLAAIQQIPQIIKCDGVNYNPITDRLVACAEFSGLALDYLAGLPAGTMLTPLVELVGADSKTYNLPLSATAQIVRCGGEPFDPNTDRIIACGDLGAAIAGMATAPLDETQALYIFQGDGAGGIELAEVPAHQAQCNYPAASQATVMTPNGWAKSESRLNSVTLTAGTHQLNTALHEVIYLDATLGNIIFNLIAPGNCERNHFWIKRLDTNALTTVSIVFAPGIDDVVTVTLQPSDLFTPTDGEAIHIHYQGPQYRVI